VLQVVQSSTYMTHATQVLYLSRWCYISTNIHFIMLVPFMHSSHMLLI